eukprot:2023342-Pyramimonas_sp.AAC.1
MAAFAWRHRTHFDTPSHVPWLHRELQRKPRWWPRAHFGAPLTRFVAESGAPPKAPMAAFAWRPRA